MADNNRLYIISGNFDQARRFAINRGLPLNRLVYVTTSEQLKGLRDVTVHITGTQPPNYYALLDEAQIRNLQIKEDET
jgi:hypothetical protein